MSPSARLNWLEKATAPTYTKTYVEQAINRYDANGRAATLDYYSTMESVNGDLYLFVLDENYEVTVNPTHSRTTSVWTSEALSVRT